LFEYVGSPKYASVYMGKDRVSKPWYVFTQYSPLPTSTFTNGGMLGGGAALVVVCAIVVVVGG
jgi:hypothetical protein